MSYRCNNNSCSSGEDYGYIGSGLKWAVTMNCEGFSMDDDEWKVIISLGKKMVEYTKENSVRDDSGQWYITLNTSDLGVGRAIITFVAYVPDDDFEDGIRTEIQEMPLITVKSLQTPADVSYHKG